MSTLRCLSMALVALAGLAGGAWWLQAQESAQLRGELVLLRAEHRELARLQAENRRLAATLPPAATLEAWRADHAAVVRLRREVARVRSDLQAREQALAGSPVKAGAAISPPP